MDGGIVDTGCPAVSLLFFLAREGSSSNPRGGTDMEEALLLSILEVKRS
jgi:hypothetical protein